MKFGRNLYVTVAGIVACSLFLVGVAEWQYSGIGVGWRIGGNVPGWRFVALMCYIAGAVGVIWLSWYWLKVAGAITSIARLLGEHTVGVTGINEVEKSIERYLESTADYTHSLEEQIKELQIQVQLSQRQKKNIEAIIYGIRDAVLVIDEFDKLLMANAAAGGLFGFDYKRSQYKPISELIKDNENGFVDFLCQSRQSRIRAARREITFSKDFAGEKEPRTFDCIVSCVHDSKEQACGVVAVLHDITREKEVAQMKNDFVSQVSHELKTPLASITAYSEMLLDGEANDEDTRKEFYSVIQNQAQRLNRLIEEILNTSRIESGLIKVNKKPVSLTIIIEEQLQMIKSYAEEKNITVSWGAGDQKPIVFDRVYVDRDMISQVVVNLLSNAVKYTRQGGSIRIDSEVDEIAGVVKVSVTDTGVGIPEDELEHVFDKFYRVGANSKQAQGTGLGLNLVKQIVEKVHNGRVFVTSQVGVGSTFGFEVPLASGETAKMESTVSRE